MGASGSNNDKVSRFANWIIDVGEGKISEPNDGIAEIEIPPDLIINYSGDPVSAIVNCLYPSVRTYIGDMQYL